MAMGAGHTSPFQAQGPNGGGAAPACRGDLSGGMGKYWHVVRIGFQNTLVYRVNFFFRAGFGLVPLLATIYLWRTVYGGQSGSIGGYSLAGMTSYYLLVTIVDTLTAVNEDDWQIAADIKDGNISQFLLKPMNFLGYRMCLFFSGKVIYAAVSLLPVGVFVYCMREYFVAPAGGMALPCFFVATLLAGLLQFFMSCALAMLSFWLLEVSTVIFISFAFEYIAGGHLFPLNILPPWLASAMNWTPFPYLLFFPVSVYLGQVKGAEMWRELGLQAGWTLAFFLIALTVWRRGIRKYSAAGG